MAEKKADGLARKLRLALNDARVLYKAKTPSEFTAILIERGLTTRPGNPWASSSVSKLLKREGARYKEHQKWLDEHPRFCMAEICASLGARGIAFVGTGRKLA